MQRQRGLTLLELLVVLAIMGVVIVGVSLSLRDSRQTQLEREAQRLVAILEASRAQSRTSGVALVWQATADGFVIQSSSPLIASRTDTWLAADTQVGVNTRVVLGPEPILAPARITLDVSPKTANAPATSSGLSLSVGTDGLRPFRVMP